MINLIVIAALTLSGATEIPENFLLHEKRARTVLPENVAAEEWWKVSDKLDRQLELKPCKGKRPTDDGRVAMRTVVQGTSAPSGMVEQLVIYKSPGTAQKALKRLRAEVLRCHKGYALRRSAIGDESFRVINKIYSYEEGQRYTYDGMSGYVVRRGRALMIYLADDHSVAGDAKKMAKKVCDLPEVCV
ncbi:hypothetical protein ACIBG8_43980 [Nonomuraea sp. NPDC050556]|uniref:hypothetical protein n=1 Tax=Nonomuraea sp. NPDC050556 TaxID=3364369 RepID=UPI00379C1CEA